MSTVNNERQSETTPHESALEQESCQVVGPVHNEQWTRAQVCKHLGWLESNGKTADISRLRREEKRADSLLKPNRIDGVWLFNSSEVEAFRLAQLAKTAEQVDSEVVLERLHALFRLQFKNPRAEKYTLEAIAKEIERPAQHVQAAHKRWKAESPTIPIGGNGYQNEKGEYVIVEPTRWVGTADAALLTTKQLAEAIASEARKADRECEEYERRQVKEQDDYEKRNEAQRQARANLREKQERNETLRRTRVKAVPSPKLPESEPTILERALGVLIGLKQKS